jgi:pimeloyl-ACP methyl ester carboxylesterase
MNEAGGFSISRSSSLRLSGYHIIWHRPELADPAHSRGTLVFSPAAGFACKTYDSFLSQLAERCSINIFTYDVRGIGESPLPVTPAYTKGRNRIGAFLADDLKQLFWSLRDYCQREIPDAAHGPWIFAGHSLGSWLSLYAALYVHVRKIVLIDPPLFPATAATKWALACALNQRDKHPLSQMTRKRKRIFRNEEQAVWVFSKLDFFRRWSPARIADYVRSNYRASEFGLVLRHNPMWEADIVESQPPSTTLLLHNLPRDARYDCKLHVAFGEHSPFNSIESQIVLASAFRNPQVHGLREAGHMLVFEREAELLELFERAILTDEFIAPAALHDKKVIGLL